MTNDAVKKENRDLKEKVRILEGENLALSERAEDIMLIGLMAENFSLLHSPEDIVDRLLERISILKKIPFCACCYIQGTDLVIQQYYSTYSLGVRTGQKFKLKPEVLLQMSMGFVGFSKEEIGKKILKIPISKKKLDPAYLAILPFESRTVKNGTLVFIKEEAADYELSQFSLLLQRVADITVSRLDSLALFREVNQLNDELDRRVEQRTGELKKVNKELKAEVENRKHIEKQLREDQLILDTLNQAQSRFFTHDEHLQVMKGLLDDILTYEGSTIGYIAETDISSPEFVELYNYIISSSEKESIRSTDQSHSFKMPTDSILGQAVISKKPVLISDIRKHPINKELPESHKSLKSYAGIPVKVDDEVVAFLGLGNNPDGYSKQTVTRLAPLLTVLRNFMQTFKLDEQRRQIEQNLEAEKVKLSEIFDSAPEAIILSDTEDKVIQVNQEFSHMFGYSSREVVGNRLPDLIGDPEGDEQELFDQAMNDFTKARIDALRKRKDGSELYVSLIRSPIQFSNGQTNLLYVIRDITKQRLVQNTLFEIAEGLLATEGDSFLQNTVTFLTDLLRIDYAFISDLSNMEDGELHSIVVSHRNEIIDNFVCPSKGTPCEKVIENSFAVFPSDVQQKFPNDSLLKELGMQSYLAIRLVDTNKNPIGILGCMCHHTMDDPGIIEQIMKIVSVRVTEELERRIRQKEAQQIQEALRQSQKLESMGRIAGGVAHDFNNILASMMGYAEFLNSKIDSVDPAMKKASETILRGTERASELTKQLLGFARKSQFSPGTVTVKSLVDETLKVSEKIFEKKIEIKVKIKPDCWNVMVDRNQLDQVLTNLFINARDAMPNGGTLTIQSENVEFDRDTIPLVRNLEPGKYVKLSVSDTGIGIPGEVKEHIFEPFFTTKDEGVGTGLGLSLAYGILNAHKGQITCYSESGVGTKFNLYLPVTDQEVHEENVDTNLEQGTEKILVVEDEQDIREVIEMQLESIGYTVVLAENGIQAVEIYKKSNADFDLVLFDLVMPGMNGIETYEHLVAINPNVRCILMSGYSKDTRAAELFKEHKVGFLQKPFRLHELTQTIQQHLS